MSQVKINLLPEAARFQLTEIRIVRRVRRWAYWVVTIALVVFGLTLIAKLLLSYQVKKLRRQKQELEVSLRQFSPQIELQQALRYRLKLAAETMRGRRSMTQLAQKVDRLLPAETLIRSIRIKGDYVEVTGLLPQLTDLDQFEKQTLAVAREYFVQATLRSLSREENYWLFTLELRLKRKR